MNRFLIIASAVVAIVVALSAYCAYELVTFPVKSDAEILAAYPSRNFDTTSVPFQEISFTTKDNSEKRTGDDLVLNGLLLKADNPKIAPTVIALHGHGGNRLDVIRYGHLFYKLGFNVLIYDQRHHGASEGKYTTYGYYESYDVSAAVDFLESTGINTDQLGIIGDSFGAATSILAGELEKRIDFVVADSSYVRMENSIEDNAWRSDSIPAFPILDLAFIFGGWIADFDVSAVAPVQAIQNIGKPVLIMHCDQDVWAYPKYAQQLYENSDKQTTVLKMFSECQHCEAYDDYPQNYELEVQKFVKHFFPEWKLQPLAADGND